MLNTGDPERSAEKQTAEWRQFDVRGCHELSRRDSHGLDSADQLKWARPGFLKRGGEVEIWLSCPRDWSGDLRVSFWLPYATRVGPSHSREELPGRHAQGRHARVHWARHAPQGRHARAGHRTRSPANAGAQMLIPPAVGPSHRMRGASPQAWCTDTCSPNWGRRCG